mmetsp:Transcript_26935/g.57991  ORF Transcript_26935/g.57991 Transcript_26935/m.57991 type:complete len:89 (-) Transcript_26935:30-296(-)
MTSFSIDYLRVHDDYGCNEYDDDTVIAVSHHPCHQLYKSSSYYWKIMEQEMHGGDSCDGVPSRRKLGRRCWVRGVLGALSLLLRQRMR